MKDTKPGKLLHQVHPFLSHSKHALPPGFLCHNSSWCVQRMRQAGAFITTCESVLFQLMGDSKHPSFKEVQKLIMELSPDSGLLTHKSQ